MFRSICAILLSVSICCGCSGSTIDDKLEAAPAIQKPDTAKFTALRGTWIQHGTSGFTLIEITDSLHVLYYQYMDKKPNSADRYWYYKSEATMGSLETSTIWIRTGKFRFDFKIKGDSLIEFDKMGDQGTFIKVETDEEKAIVK